MAWPAAVLPCFISRFLYRPLQERTGHRPWPRQAALVRHPLPSPPPLPAGKGSESPSVVRGAGCAALRLLLLPPAGERWGVPRASRVRFALRGGPCPRLRLRAAPRGASARLTRARPAAGRAAALPALPTREMRRAFPVGRPGRLRPKADRRAEDPGSATTKETGRWPSTTTTSRTTTSVARPDPRPQHEPVGA